MLFGVTLASIGTFGFIAKEAQVDSVLNIGGDVIKMDS